MAFIILDFCPRGYPPGYGEAVLCMNAFLVILFSVENSSNGSSTSSAYFY